MTLASRKRLLSIALTFGATRCINGDETNTQGCSLCPGGEDVGFPKKTIPTTNEKCEDNNYLDVAPDSDECQDFQRSAAWCGCPGVTQGCSLCPGGESSPTPKLPSPLFPDMSCLDYEFASSQLTSEECPSLFERAGNFDVSAYCSCEGTSKPSLCELCPGGEIVNPEDESIIPGTNCEDANNILHYFTDKSLCLEFRGLLLFDDACKCNGSTDYPTKSPTLAPTIQTPSPTPAPTAAPRPTDGDSKPSASGPTNSGDDSTKLSKKEKKSKTKDSRKKSKLSTKRFTKSDWKDRKQYGASHQKLRGDKHEYLK